MSEIAGQLERARGRLRDRAPAVSYLTVQEVADLARCDDRTVRRAIGSGMLRAFRPARRLLVSDADAREWVESRPVAGAQPMRRPPQRRRETHGSVAELRELERRAAE